MRPRAWWMLLAAVAVLVAYAALRPGPRDTASSEQGATSQADADVLAPPLSVPAAPPDEPPESVPPPDADALGEVMQGEAEPPRELILSALRGAIESYLPDRKLSSDEYARLADAVETLRGSRKELNELEYTPENAERRRELVDAVGMAVAEFEYLLEMSPGEFTDRAQPGVGLSQDAPGEAVPPPEYLDDRPPPAG